MSCSFCVFQVVTDLVRRARTRSPSPQMLLVSWDLISGLHQSMTTRLVKGVLRTSTVGYRMDSIIDEGEKYIVGITYVYTNTRGPDGRCCSGSDLVVLLLSLIHI